MYSSTNDFNNTSIGLAGTDYQNKDIVVPDSIKFKTVKRTIAARRVPVKIRTDQLQYNSTQNKLIRILLPNASIFDTRKGYLTFNAQVSVTGGTYRRFASGIFTIFNRLRILAGTTEIEDIRDYNRIYAILYEMQNPILSTGNIGVTTMGFGTQADRNALGLTNGEYACPIFSGVLGTELLPFDNIPTGITLELYIEDPTVCIETDGSVPIITVSNVQFHIERLELDASYRSFIAGRVRTSGLTLGFHSWERYTTALTTGAQQNININQRNSSVNGFLNIFVNSAELNTTTVNDKFLTWLPRTIQTTSLLINGNTYPDEPIDCVFANATEPYQGYLRWIQKWELDGIVPIAPSINNQAYNTDRFVQIDDLEPFPELDDVINTFNTLQNNTSITKKLQFAGVIPANIQLDTWIEYFRLVCIYPDGTIKVVQ